jgi:16S rRNA (guanine527-N7)-methyltransferase
LNLIQKYFPDLSEKQIFQFEQLKDLYLIWNAQINVISRKDIDELYIRHVLHSLAIAELIEFQPGSIILDLGTGGGFPGIPLAIMFPKVEFHCVDSIGKKITVVKEVSKALGLSNVNAYQERVENLPLKFDFVVSRAVARCLQLNQWVKKKIKKENNNPLPNGYIFLKGGELQEELQEYADSARIDVEDIMQIPLQEFFEEEFFETKKLIYIPKNVY